MKRTTFSITYFCRESKKDKKGFSPIELSLIINGKRVFWNMPRKERPDEFKKLTASKRGNELKDYLEIMRVNINKAMTDMMTHSIPITAASVREYIQGGGIKTYTVEDLFNDYLNNLKVRVGVSMQESVYRKYEIARDLVYEVIGKDKEVNVLTNSVIANLYDNLKKRYKHSTAAGYYTKIKTIFVYAFDNGILNTNICSGIKIDKGHPSQEYLTEPELECLAKADLMENERLEKVRDILLFQAYGGGMAYCDMVCFNPDKMIESNGVYIYSGTRKKTGIEFTTVLLPKAIEILKKYNYCLPFISNQKLNLYAKELMGLSGIRKNLHTHLMRKSYATMLINRSVPITTICKCMGHSNSAITTKIYAHTQQETIANEVAKAFQ